MPTYPHLDYKAWQATRETLHLYSKLLGNIKRAIMPAHPYWWHISLQVNENGLATGPMPVPNKAEDTFTLNLDLETHQLRLILPKGRQTFSLESQRPHFFVDSVRTSLSKADIQLDLDQAPFYSREVHDYNPNQAQDYKQAITQINDVFHTFVATLPGETSPIQLWPHHFDLAFSWYTESRGPSLCWRRRRP